MKAAQPATLSLKDVQAVYDAFLLALETDTAMACRMLEKAKTAKRRRERSSVSATGIA